MALGPKRSTNYISSITTPRRAAMDDSIAKIGDDADLRRSKRNKFHLDIIGMQFQLPRKTIKKHRPLAKPFSNLPKETHSEITNEGKSTEKKAGSSVSLTNKSTAKNTKTSEKIKAEKVPEMNIGAQFVNGNKQQTNANGKTAVPKIRQQKRRKKRVEPKPIRVEDVLSDCQESDVSNETREEKVSRIVDSVIGRQLGDVETDRLLGMPESGRVPFKCQKCPSAFDTRTGLANHLKLHSADIKRRLSCLHCDFSCDNLKTMRFHKRFHDTLPLVNKQKGEKGQGQGEGAMPRRLLFCPECPFQTKNAKRLLAHEVGHRRSSGFRCPICSFRSTSAGFLKRHAEGHGVENLPWPPVYEGSPRPSYRSQALKRHTVKANDNKSSSSILSHTKPLIRNSKGQFAPKYGQDVPTDANFDEFSEVTKRQFKCSSCSDIFPNRCILIAHKRCIHKKMSKWDSKRRTWLSCRHCGLLFSDYGRLKIHKLILFRQRANMKHWMNRMLSEWRKLVEQTIGEKSPVNNSTVIPLKNGAEKAARIQSCPECPYLTPNKTDMVKHSNNHSADWSNACTECSFSCKSAANLSQHTQMHDRAKKRHSEDVISVASCRNPRFFCPSCPYRSKISSDLKSHEKMHTGNRKFNCTVCTYSTHRPNALELHEKLHQKDRPDQQSTASVTEACNEQKKEKGKRKRKTYLMKDMRGVIMGCRREDVYMCRFCPFQSPICSQLAQHARSHLGSPRPFKCPLCTFSTALHPRLQRHAKLHPLSTSISLSRSRRQGGYHCRSCPFVSVSYPRLWHHMQKHKRKGKFTCDKCTFSTGSPLCMAQHKNVHELTSVSTETGQISVPMAIQAKNNRINKTDVLPEETSGSSKSVEVKPTLSALRKSVTRLKKEETDQCGECPYWCDNDTVLKLHKQMHGGRPRAFRCMICSYSANVAESLHQHLSLHVPRQEKEKHSLQKPLVSRKRTNSFTTQMPIRPNYQGVFNCNLCSFRTSQRDRLSQHEGQHIQLAQQRLMATIKRSVTTANDWSLFDYPKNRRLDRRMDRQFCCSKCSFYSDTATALHKHVQMHASLGAFGCSLCDYRHDHQNVIRFHQQRHHTDLPVTLTCNQAEKAKKHQLNKIGAMVNSNSEMLSCSICHYETNLVPDMKTHWNGHSEEIDSNGCSLSFLNNLNLLPINWLKEKTFPE